jgi:hypothetical protein
MDWAYKELLQKSVCTPLENLTDYSGKWQNMKHGAIYGFGVIGAAVYFVQNSRGFWMGCIGVLKALVWPAIIVYKVLELLKL